MPPRTVNAAFVQSRRALANYHFRLPGDDGQADVEAVLGHLRQRWPGFIELVTWKQIPDQGINGQGMGGDQPLLAVEQVSYVGQAIALVAAGPGRCPRCPEHRLAVSSRTGEKVDLHGH